VEGGEDAFIALAQQGGEDVLADLLSPQVVAAIAAGDAGGVQVHPVELFAPLDAIAAGADASGMELQAALQTVQIDASEGVEVDGGFRHFGFLKPVCSSKKSSLVAAWIEAPTCIPCY
jgi:hypothetical protein